MSHAHGFVGSLSQPSNETTSNGTTLAGIRDIESAHCTTRRRLSEHVHVHRVADERELKAAASTTAPDQIIIHARRMSASARVKLASATAVTQNTASWRILEKNCFVRESTIPGGHTKHGLTPDVFRYVKPLVSGQEG